MHYLGHVISTKGILVDPAKIEAIVDWPTPQSVTKVGSFMGLARYYKKYVEGFSRIIIPITSLQKKGKKMNGLRSAMRHLTFETKVDNNTSLDYTRS